MFNKKKIFFKKELLTKAQWSATPSFIIMSKIMCKNM